MNISSLQTRTRIFLALAFLALALLPAPARAAAEAGGGVGSVPQDFEGDLVLGGYFRLADHIGRDVVVLNFFTSDCAPCRVEMPALEKFYNAHKDDGFTLLEIDEMDSLPQAKSFLNWMKLSLPTAVDPGALARALNVSGYPTTIMIGTDGTIRFFQLGVIDVPNTLGTLLASDHAMFAERGRMSQDAFLSQQRDAHLEPIRLIAPEAKPVAGFAPEDAKKDEIFSITIAHETPGEVDVDVDYYYSGSHGLQRVYIDCDPHLADGGAPFAMRPAVVEVGRHTARAPLMSYDGTPAGTVSTDIACVMASRLDSAQMASKKIDYKKRWGR